MWKEVVVVHYVVLSRPDENHETIQVSIADIRPEN